jgi:capsular polysaccharide biosynthesis protein
VRVQRFTRWGSELEVYHAPEVLYLPDYRMQLWKGFAPEEAVNYEPHLAIAKNRVPAGLALFDLATAERSDLEVCILANPCTPTFGHWAEELLKVLILEESGFQGQYVLARSLQAVWFDSLALLGVGRDRILVPERPVLFASAAYTTVVHHFVAHHFPGVFCALRDRLHAATKDQRGAGERIWIDRGIAARNSHGNVLNRDAVDEVLREFGFRTVDFGQLTFADQVAVDREARIVAGTHGSAFVHVGFMGNGARVLEIFSPHFINPSVIQLCLALKHSYRQMVPVNSPQQPYTHAGIMVDIDHLRLALGDLCVKS